MSRRIVARVLWRGIALLPITLVVVFGGGGDDGDDE